MAKSPAKDTNPHTGLKPPHPEHEYEDEGIKYTKGSEEEQEVIGRQWPGGSVDAPVREEDKPKPALPYKQSPLPMVEGTSGHTSALKYEQYMEMAKMGMDMAGSMSKDEDPKTPKENKPYKGDLSI